MEGISNAEAWKQAMFCHQWDRTQNHQSLEHIEEGQV